ncbi:hypothetical protein [Nonomuraea salmonea]|uniref:hypothetical protein n=1 Tax=Nonomuraea salmonea TaxID=46181 RepID=UPI002FE7ACF6
MTVTGNGSATDPYTVSVAGGGGGGVECSAISGCAGDGLEVDPATGRWRVKISGDEGNAAKLGGDGGIFAPAGGEGGGPATVTAGPGLTGNGSAATPVAASVSDWPYTCEVDEQAGLVYVDSAGKLRSEPRGKIQYFTASQQETYENVAVPADETLIVTRTVSVTNPDPCRDALAITMTELDVDFNLPAGAAASQYMYGEEMARFVNNGSSIIRDAHVQTTKVLANTTIPAGATQDIGLTVSLGRGSGGATYNRIQTHVRAVLIAL